MINPSKGPEKKVNTAMTIKPLYVIEKIAKQMPDPHIGLLLNQVHKHLNCTAIFW